MVAPNTKLTDPAPVLPGAPPACKLDSVLDIELLRVAFGVEKVGNRVADMVGAAVIVSDELEPILLSVRGPLELDGWKEVSVLSNALSCPARAVVAAAGVEGTNVDEMLSKEELAAAESVA